MPVYIIHYPLRIKSPHFFQNGLTPIWAWISDHISNSLYNVIMNTFLKFSGDLSNTLRELLNGLRITYKLITDAGLELSSASKIEAKRLQRCPCTVTRMLTWISEMYIILNTSS